MKIWKYIIIRYIVTFVLFFTIIYREWHFEGWECLSCSLDSFEDWFMFFWLFILPILFEYLYQGLLLAHCLEKLKRQNWFILLLLILLSFFLEFIVTIQIFAINFVSTKLIVSILLFLIFYGQEIIKKRRLNINASN
jgi:hypothetical protein